MIFVTGLSIRGVLDAIPFLHKSQFVGTLDPVAVEPGRHFYHQDRICSQRNRKSWGKSNSSGCVTLSVHGAVIDPLDGRSTLLENILQWRAAIQFFNHKLSIAE